MIPIFTGFSGEVEMIIIAHIAVFLCGANKIPKIAW